MDRDLLAQRINDYTFFSYLFFKLPDAGFVSDLLALDIGDDEDDEGSVLLKRFISQNQDREYEALASELGVDRTRLLRGLTHEGPRPPFESLFLDVPPQVTLGALNVIYASVGFEQDAEKRESKEYIGTEINFMLLLCKQELSALDSDDPEEALVWQQKQAEFFGRHLGLWGVAVAEELQRHARTDFYQAVALMLRDFINSEIAYFSAI